MQKKFPALSAQKFCAILCEESKKHVKIQPYPPIISQRTLRNAVRTKKQAHRVLETRKKSRPDARTALFVYKGKKTHTVRFPADTYSICKIAGNIHRFTLFVFSAPLSGFFPGKPVAKTFAALRQPCVFRPAPLFIFLSERYPFCFLSVLPVFFLGYPKYSTVHLPA